MTPQVTTQEAALGRQLIQQVGFSNTLRQVWADRRTRQFFVFLSLATLAAWMQDAILEPFGAEVFDLPISRTTRLNSYWQAATVITLIGSTVLWRQRPPEHQTGVAGSGLILMAIGIGLLGVTSFVEQVRLLEFSLLVFGAGFGIYTFGGLSLMAVMASDKEAGIYLGLWTISILVFKGLGTFLGGLLRDICLLVLHLSPAVGYGLIFGLAAVGLIGSVSLLRRIDILGFARDTGRVLSRSEVQAATSD